MDKGLSKSMSLELQSWSWHAFNFPRYRQIASSLGTGEECSDFPVYKSTCGVCQIIKCLPVSRVRNSVLPYSVALLLMKCVLEGQIDTLTAWRGLMVQELKMTLDFWFVWLGRWWCCSASKRKTFWEFICFVQNVFASTFEDHFIGYTVAGYQVNFFSFFVVLEFELRTSCLLHYALPLEPPSTPLVNFLIFLTVLALEHRVAHLLGFTRQVLYYLSHSTSPSG
jgi:hypothetical protein